MSPSIAILIRSYHRDAAWLSLAVTSVQRFVVGCRELIVVLPHASVDRLDWLRFPALRQVTIRECDDYPDDYIGQQITKLHADRFTDADVILHVDSDQVFVNPCDLRARLFDRGTLRMAFDGSGARPPTDGWRRCASVFMREDVPLDVTVPAPVAMPRALYADVRAFCEEAHGCSIAQYASTLRADRFSEFAVLRAYALMREREAFAWVDVSRRRVLPECRTFWSRAQTPAQVMPQLPVALFSTHRSDR
jgi:hypothetical protein